MSMDVRRTYVYASSLSLGPIILLTLILRPTSPLGLLKVHARAIADLCSPTPPVCSASAYAHQVDE